MTSLFPLLESPGKVSGSQQLSESLTEVKLKGESSLTTLVILSTARWRFVFDSREKSNIGFLFTLGCLVKTHRRREKTRELSAVSTY